MADNDNAVTPTPENPIPDVDEIKPGIPDPAWNDEGGGGLPVVTSQDAGKVLTVSDDGEWVAGEGGGSGTGGGGALIVTATINDGVIALDKTFAEIKAAVYPLIKVVVDSNRSISTAFLPVMSVEAYNEGGGAVLVASPVEDASTYSFDIWNFLALTDADYPDYNLGEANASSHN